MQLTPTDQIVLVSGLSPIRAKKARYYEDARLSERILPPPRLAESPLAASRPLESRADDWTGRIAAAPEEPPAPSLAAELLATLDEESDS